MAKLLSVTIWHQREEAVEYDLTAAEVRRALTVGAPAVRKNASWNLWRLMSDVENENEEGEKGSGALPDEPTRWRTIVGPIFRAIWPLDARLRSKTATRNLVMMALESGDAFPEAVDAISDVIIPYQLYQISHSLRLEQKHRDLLRQHPVAFVRLVNALIDPAAFPVPDDLPRLLDECVGAAPSVVQYRISETACNQSAAKRLALNR